MKTPIILSIILILISCEGNLPTVGGKEYQDITWKKMTSVNLGPYHNLWIQSLIKNSRYHMFAATGRSIFRSIDEGLSWQKLDLEIMAGCRLVINSKDWLFAVNNSSLYVSKDNGDSWSRIGTGSSNIFIDPNDHIYMGNNLKNLKSIDDGNSWITINLDGWVRGFYFSEPNYIFACICFGGIYQSVDNGVSWESITGNLRLNQNESDVRTMDVDTDGTIYIGTPDGLFIKKMTGDNWQKVEQLKSYINSVKTCSNGFTFVATDTLGAYYTIDNGKTWRLNIEGLATPRIFDILEYKVGYLIAINVVGEWHENALYRRQLYY